MKRILLSATCSFAIVYSAGFVFGVIRVFLTEPAIGRTYAVALEAPFMLISISAAARWLPLRFGLEMKILPLVLMGVGALVLQQVADFAFGSLVRNIPLEEQFAYLSTSAGIIYLALLVFYVFAPLATKFGRANPLP